MIGSLQLAAYVVIVAFVLRTDLRLRGEAGRRRLEAMDQVEAADTFRDHSSRFAPGFTVFLACVFAVNAVGGVVSQAWISAAVGIVGLALAVGSYRVRKEVTPQVLEVLAERRGPLPPAEETSLRRSRRVRQLVVVTVLTLPLGLGLVAAGARTGSTALTVAGLLLTVVGVVALAGAGWARAWRYGDEQPAPEV